MPRGERWFNYQLQRPVEELARALDLMTSTAEEHRDVKLQALRRVKSLDLMVESLSSAVPPVEKDLGLRRNLWRIITTAWGEMREAWKRR